MLKEGKNKNCLYSIISPTKEPNVLWRNKTNKEIYQIIKNKHIIKIKLNLWLTAPN